jgi:arsenate reductase-like glutaredoxin family protein
MENNINAHCSICGNGYHLCLTCQGSKINPWRSIVDSVEHYKIFIVIRDYENKYIDKDEANKLLSQCDLTELDNFIPEIKDKIKEIMVIEKKNKNIMNSEELNL